MQRRRLLITMAVMLAATTVCAQQQPERVLRVGSISMSTTPAGLAEAERRRLPFVLHYEQEMRRRGWIEGRNLVTLWRTAEGRPERIAEIAADLARSKVEVIVVGFVGMAEAAAKGAPAVPIFSQAGDPGPRGLVQSLNRPGGNINGIFAAGTITVEQKRLELLRELVPNLRRVAFVANHEWWDGIWGKSLREAAASLGLQALYVESKPASFSEAFAELRRAKPDAAYFEPSPAAFNLRASIGEFAASSGIPSACGHQELVEAGCLMTYNFTIAETVEVQAEFIDRIAKGAKAGEIPYRQYSRYEFALNARTAKALRIKVPQSVLLRADRVIE